MKPQTMILCDGCGMAASSEHIAERLKRLEWATRYRPVHISVLFLGAASPRNEAEYLYQPAGEGETVTQAISQGEAGRILEAVGISGEATLVEFQRRGYFLTHVLECAAPAESLADALARQLPIALTRIRRSLKPRRIVVFSRSMVDILPLLAGSDLGERLVLDEGQPFDLESAAGAAERLRQRLP